MKERNDRHHEANGERANETKRFRAPTRIAVVLLLVGWRRAGSGLTLTEVTEEGIMKLSGGNLWTLAALILAVDLRASAPQSESKNKTIIYFLRHAEDVAELSDPSFTVSLSNCNADSSCCLEVLNPLGQVRAAALASWFEAENITKTLTHVIASHKIRTRQTVQEIAKAAGLGGDLEGDGVLDGTDVDQAPGDGVIDVPSTPLECDPGFTSSSSVRQPQIDYLKTLPIGSRAVVCSHSPVLYPLMQAFGIDTSDPLKFPKDSRGRVSGFNNVWIVEFDSVEVDGALQYQGRLLDHLLLDLNLDVSLINREHHAWPEEDDEE